MAASSIDVRPRLSCTSKRVMRPLLRRDDRARKLFTNAYSPTASLVPEVAPRSSKAKYTAISTHLISSHLTHLDRPSLSSNITRFRPCRGWFLLLRWREDAAARGEMLTVTSGVSVGDSTQDVMCWCSRRVKGGNEVGVQFRRAKT